MAIVCRVLLSKKPFQTEASVGILPRIIAVSIIFVREVDKGLIESTYR